MKQPIFSHLENITVQSNHIYSGTTIINLNLINSSIYKLLPQAGFDPPFAEGAEFSELKTDALTNQATMAGL